MRCISCRAMSILLLKYRYGAAVDRPTSPGFRPGYVIMNLGSRPTPLSLIALLTWLLDRAANHFPGRRPSSGNGTKITHNNQFSVWPEPFCRRTETGRSEGIAWRSLCQYSISRRALWNITKLGVTSPRIPTTNPTLYRS